MPSSVAWMSKPDFPLTRFIINAREATPDQLKRANPKKMAASYGISEKHAEDIIKWERMMKGVR